MSLRPNLRSALHFIGVIVFIALGALSASRARSDPLTEVYLLGLIGVGVLAIVVGAGPTVRENGDAAAAEFERRADAALAAVLTHIRDQAAEGEKFSESLAGANRKLARVGSYDTINEIVLTLINDNRAMQHKVNGLTEKLEQSRFQIMRLRSSLNKAEEIGSRNSLTGLGNRRYFDAALNEEIDRAREEDKTLCVSLADIDHFKAINDKFGHMAGDVVLKRFADLLTANIKGEDKVARFGGEEFAILFPDADLADATSIVNQIQKQLEAKRWAVAASGERLGAVTASFGVARLRDGESADELLRRVDAKLYEAKANGRNRVVVDAQRARRGRVGVVSAPPRARKRAPTSFGSVLAEVESGGGDPERIARPLGYPFAAVDPPAEAADSPTSAWDQALAWVEAAGEPPQVEPRSRRSAGRRIGRAALRLGRAARRADGAADRRSRRHRRRTGLGRRADARPDQHRAAALHVGQPSRSPARRAARTRQSPGGDRQHAARPRRSGARGEAATRVARTDYDGAASWK